MKKKYDFSKGIKGKFYISKNEIELPVYLDKQNLDYYLNIAKEKNIAISKIINDVLSKDREIIDTLK